MSFGIMPQGQQYKRYLDDAIYQGARGQKRRNVEAFKTEEAIESGYLKSAATGAGVGATVGFMAGGPLGAVAGGFIGGFGGFLTDYFL